MQKLYKKIVFKTSFCYVAQAGLRLKISQPQTSPLPHMLGLIDMRHIQPTCKILN